MNDDFPKNEEEAEKFFKNYEHFDPFPWIPPALLNSADIYNYVRVTGMIHPFEDKNKLKSASYEIDFLGEVYYWDDTDKEYHFGIEIKKDDPFTIPKNSIVFVSPQTIFHLPDYIALRFNLRIKHVHRGLLLGTGPLVDPGFVGRLFIPLHNLTSENYIMYGGEGLIWIEFTKLSPHDHWINDRQEHKSYNHFPVESRKRTPQQYLNASSNGKPAKSSIPDEVKNIREHAEQAESSVKEAGSFIKLLSSIGVVGVLALVFITWDLTSNANQNITTARDQMDDFSEKLNESVKKIEILEAQIISLKRIIKESK